MRLATLTVAVGAAIAIAATAVAFQNSQDNRRGQQQAPAGMPDGRALVAAMAETPGFLGHELGQVMSGKQVIFAWFEDKASVRAWYKSEVHRSMMKQFFGTTGKREPLPELADDFGPILAIASITMADQAQLQETSMPISQIAIELYTPISGGLFLGERFAPESVKVGNLRDYTPSKQGE